MLFKEFKNLKFKKKIHKVLEKGEFPDMVKSIIFFSEMGKHFQHFQPVLKGILSSLSARKPCSCVIHSVFVHFVINIY